MRSGTDAAASASFLEEADAGVFPTATSVIVLNEVIHRLIIASVVSSSGISPESVVHQIKLHPELVRKARAVWEVMEDIRSIRSMKIYGISPATFERSLIIMQDWGLLGTHLEEIVHTTSEKIFFDLYKICLFSNLECE